jgi:hypothetical protein
LVLITHNLDHDRVRSLFNIITNVNKHPRTRSKMIAIAVCLAGLINLAAGW